MRAAADSVYDRDPLSLTRRTMPLWIGDEHGRARRRRRDAFVLQAREVLLDDLVDRADALALDHLLHLLGVEGLVFDERVRELQKRERSNVAIAQNARQSAHAEKRRCGRGKHGPGAARPL